ncbi:MAG: 50S ribosomal protein L24 [Candidatus Micrarchaeota archaeon]|nr:50S ribosomal protein L24 [Candidatus Micrarchaeota archaeon]
MIQSAKPRKQRFFRFNAPMHVRQHFAHSHIDDSLKAKLNIKKNSVEVRKGDTVKIMSGSARGTTGKVTSVNLRTGKIYLDSLTKKNAKGKEFGRPVGANNVYIIDMDLSDKIRAAKLKVQVVAKKKEEPKPKKEAAPTAGQEKAEAAAERVAEHTKDLMSKAVMKETATG